MADKNLHSGHRQRMKQRFLNYPAEFMYDHELLEIALFYTRPVVNTNSHAHALLESAGSVSGVLGADISELEAIKGIGRNSAVFIKLLNEGVLRCLSHDPEGTVLGSFDSIREHFSSYFHGSDSELCCIAIVDASMALMNNVCLPFGDIVSGMITQRDIAELLIMRSAYRIIMGIYHPFNVTAPIPDDFAVTNMISELISPLGIELIDSVVCGTSAVFSMRSSGSFSFTG